MLGQVVLAWSLASSVVRRGLELQELEPGAVGGCQASLSDVGSRFLQGLSVCGRVCSSSRRGGLRAVRPLTQWHRAPGESRSKPDRSCDAFELHMP